MTTGFNRRLRNSNMNMSRRGHDNGVMLFKDRRIKFGESAIEIVLVGNLRSALRIGFADRHDGPACFLKTSYMALANGTGANDEDSRQLLRGARAHCVRDGVDDRFARRRLRSAWIQSQNHFHFDGRSEWKLRDANRRASVPPVVSKNIAH